MNALTAVTVRRGTEADLPQVLALIKELAEYERAAPEVENTVERMQQDGFGPQPLFGFFVAETSEQLIGLALYYFRYSTWKGKRLYLEDLVVSESWRGHGVGHQLFAEILRETASTQASGVVWQVLEWNQPAIRFYEKYGAQFDTEWTNCSLSREQVAAWLERA